MRSCQKAFTSITIVSYIISVGKNFKIFYLVRSALNDGLLEMFEHVMRCWWDLFSKRLDVNDDDDFVFDLECFIEKARGYYGMLLKKFQVYGYNLLVRWMLSKLSGLKIDLRQFKCCWYFSIILSWQTISNWDLRFLIKFYIKASFEFFTTLILVSYIAQSLITYRSSAIWFR